MILLFKLISITFILVMSFKIVTSRGMLLESLGYYFERKVDDGHKYFEAFTCPWCLPTICSIGAHGFAFGLGVLPMEWNWQLLIRWPLVVGGASFLCGNAWNIYETISRIRERNEAEAEYFNSLLDHETEQSEN